MHCNLLHLLAKKKKTGVFSGAKQLGEFIESVPSCTPVKKSRQIRCKTKVLGQISRLAPVGQLTRKTPTTKAAKTNL